MSANAAVFAEFKGRGGATLSAVAWDSLQLVTVNVGDSRIWVMSETGQLTLWTRDDSIAAQLQAQGIPGAEDARRDLLQFIGTGEEMSPHVEERAADCIRLVMATSDGAHEVPQLVLERIIQHATNPTEVARKLIDLSLWLGGIDNASVACFKPSKMLPGASGIVDLWVPAGYWRLVRPDSTVSSERLGTNSLPPSLPQKPVTSRPSQSSPSANDETNEQLGAPSSEKSRKAKNSGKRKRISQTRSPSPLFDDARKREGAAEQPASKPEHVKVRIGTANDADSLPPEASTEPPAHRE